MNEDQLPLFSNVPDMSNVHDISSAKTKRAEARQPSKLSRKESFCPPPYSTVEENFEKLHQQLIERDQLRDEKIQSQNELIERLTVTIANLIPCMEMGVSGEKAHIYVDSSRPERKADIATIASSLPAEVVYPCTTSDLAQLIGNQASRLGTLLKNYGIKGNPDYHHSFKNGLKSTTQRYKMTALSALYEKALENPQWIKPLELEKLKNYFSLKELDK